MDSETLRKKLERNESLILLDVREPDEVQEQPFFVVAPKNYINLSILPLVFRSKKELSEQIFSSLGVSETTPIVTLCRSGGRSARVCEQLCRFGWQAENLEGGVIGWGNPL